MGQDNGLDNPFPISKEGLIAALDSVLDVLPNEESKLWEHPDAAKAEVSIAIECLQRLRLNVQHDRTLHYPSVVRNANG